MINDEHAKKPSVSILMPVYNAEKFLRPAVASILDQKGIFDYEVIIVDDGSTDKSFDILQELGDERFLILRRKQNKGLIAGLNAGLLRCQAPLIARMDADDIMYPERLIKQVDLMNRNPALTACGTYFDYIDENGRTTGAPVKFPIHPQEVREAFKKYTAIGHPTTMFRKAALFQLVPELYPARYPHAEDLALWLILLSKGAALANVEEVLLHYRMHEEQVRSKYAQIQAESSRRAYKDWSYLVWPDEILKAKPKRKIHLQKKG